MHFLVEDLDRAEGSFRSSVEGGFQGGREVVHRRVDQVGDESRRNGAHGVDGQLEAVVAEVVDGDVERVVVALLDVSGGDAFEAFVELVVDIVDPEAAVVVSVVEERGEQGRVAGDTAGLLRDRQRGVLMGHQACQLRAHRGHRRPDSDPLGGDAGGQGVHEQPERPVRTGARAHTAKEYGPEDHVVPARDRGKHPCPGHVPHRRRADTETAGHSPHPGRHTLVDRPLGAVDLAAVPMHVQQAERRGRFGHVSQQLGKESGVISRGEVVAGLRDEIPERHRSRQLRALTAHERAYFLEQQRHARVVLDQVVHPQQTQVPAIGCTGGVHVHQRSRRQIDRAADRTDQRLHRVGDRSGVKNHLLDPQPGLAPHHLHRLGEPVPDHARAVHVVPVDHVLQRGGEGVQPRSGVELQHHHRHIGVHPALGQQVMEQQPLLEGRQRIDVRHVGRAPGHRGHHPLDLRFRQPRQRHHLRSDPRGAHRDSPSGDRRRIRRRAGDLGHRGQPGGSRRLEQRPHRGHIPARPQPLHQADRQERMPAQSEEVVVDTDRGRVKDLGERGARRLLTLVHRRAGRRVGGVRGNGQGVVVEFSVDGQGEGVEGDDGGRHHVVRQLGRRVLPQVRHIHVTRAGHAAPGALGDDVGDEPLLAGLVLAHHDRDLVHARPAGQYGPHFTGLDAESPDLHLVVGAPGEDQPAVRVPPDPVPGAVHPLATAVRRVRAGHEPLGAQRRVADISPRQPGARYVQFTGHTDRHRPQPVVKDQRTRRHHGLTDDRLVARHQHGGHRRRDRRLRRAVPVEEPPPFAPPAHQPPVQRLARRDQRPHRARVALRVQHRQHRRRHRRMGHPPPVEHLLQACPGHHLLGRRHHQHSARAERHHPFPHRAVEPDRRELQHPRLAVHAVQLPLGGHQPRHAAMGEHDALRPPRRPRCVGHVRRAQRGQWPTALRIRHRPVVQLCQLSGHRRPVHDEDRHIQVRRHRPDALLGCHHARGTAVREHEPHPLARHPRIDRHEHRPGLPHPQQHRRHIDAALQHHAHGCPHAHSGAPQPPRHPVGPPVQLVVRNVNSRTHQGLRARVPAHLLLEQRQPGRLQHLTPARLAVRLQPAPLHQPLPLPRHQHIGGMQCEVGSGGELVEHVGPALGDRRCSGRGEEVRRRGQSAAQPRGGTGGVVGLGKSHFEVEPGGEHQSVGGYRAACPYSGQVEGTALDVLEGEHDLEERVAAHGPARGELLDQPLERHVLVGQRLDAALPHPSEQIAEGRVTAQVGPDDEGVEEVADEVVQAFVRTPGHGRPDRDVRARAEPRQQHRERGLQHHEHRHALGAGQLHEPGVQFGGNRQRHDVGAVVGHRGPGPVERQLQLLRNTVQRPTPVVDLPGQEAVLVVLVAEQLPLPQRVVRVLHRQGRPLRRPARTAFRVGEGQITGQRAHGPAVAGDVVHDEHQYPLVRVVPTSSIGLRGAGVGVAAEAQFAEARLDQVRGQVAGQVRGYGSGLEEPGPEGDFAGEVEGVRRLLPYGLDEARPVRCRPQVHDLQVPVEIPGVHDLLVRLAVDAGEDRTQALVPADDVPQGGGERGAIQVAGQAQGDGQVVRGVRALQLAEEPQPLLRERQRHARRALARGQGGPRPAGPLLVEVPSQQGRGRRLEQRPHLHLGAEEYPDPRYEPDDQQRMPTQREEVVVDTYRVHTKHLGERLAQQRLTGIGGPADGPVPQALLRRGQGLVVELPVDGQRQPVEGYDGGRNHVVRQPGRRVIAQPRHIDATRHTLRGVGDDVRDQPFLPRHVLPHHHRGLSHTRAAGQHRPHLCGLDPEPPDLHLVVRTPREHQLPVRVPPHAVPGPVHPLTCDERARHEPFRTERTAADVAARQPGACHVEFTGHPDRHRPQPVVKDQRTGRHDRRSDDRLVPGCQYRRDRRRDRGLGRAVPVEEPAPGPPSAYQPPVHRFTGRDQRPHRACVALRVQHRQHRRRHGRVGHLPPVEELLQAGPRHQLLGRRHHQHPARAQSHDPLGHRPVEADRRELQHTRIRTHTKSLTLRGHQPSQATVRQHDALRTPGRPRRVRHIGRAQCRHRTTALGIRHRFAGQPGQLPGHRRLIDDQYRDAQVVGHRPGVLTGRHHTRRTGVREHITHPLARHPRIDRHEHRAGLPHPQQDGYDIDSTAQHHPDRRTDAHPHTPEPTRDSTGPHVQLRVGDLDSRAHHRRRVRVPRHALLEQPQRSGRLTGPVCPTGTQPTPIHQPVPLPRHQHIGTKDGFIRARTVQPLQRPSVSQLGLLVALRGMEAVDGDGAVAEAGGGARGNEVDLDAAEGGADVEAEFAKHVVVRETPVLQRGVERAGARPYEVLCGHQGSEAHAHGQHVGGRPGVGGLGLGACADADDHIVVAGQLAQGQCGGRDGDRVGLGRRVQAPPEVTGGFGQVGEGVGPVAPVLLVRRGVEVLRREGCGGRVGRGGRTVAGCRALPRLRGLRAGDERGVVRGHPVAELRSVPEHMAAAENVEGLRGARGPGVLAHTELRGCPRVCCRAQIHQRDVDGGLFGGRFRQCGAHRLPQQIQIETAANLDVFARISRLAGHQVCHPDPRHNHSHLQMPEIRCELLRTAASCCELS
ncbi:putative Nonribosomal peptide synthetase [Streptomyces viridochromogenes Tue57]|uniref:Putative Nonribosomal peptide synthetase n=1 Tax=Streptomyces viridochromogenes Tue57 TaxID=1160705 RepID=L8P4S7_STRVR|nr:putative Nonribosomal peptide synthetase [Streptomyces viridochromogenes Tue57]